MLFESQFVQFLSFFDFMIGVSDDFVGTKNLSQECLAFEQRRWPEVVTVTIKNIEDIINHGDLVMSSTLGLMTENRCCKRSKSLRPSRSRATISPSSQTSCPVGVCRQAG